jgi:hypothetical protein
MKMALEAGFTGVMMAKKKFDPSKPHNHKCEKCNAEIHCRAVDCQYPEWTECADCVEGWGYAIQEGSVVKRKEIPGRVGIDRMFP